MGEIEIIIDNKGNAKVSVTTVQGEDPACLTMQKLTDGMKSEGAVVTESQMDARGHGHVHDFAHH